MPTQLMSANATRPAVGITIANSGVVTEPVPLVNLSPVQLMGFVPMHDCSSVECRKFYADNCYTNIVFGNVISGKGGFPVAVSTSTYENDWNTFAVDMSLYTANPTLANIVWHLQKCSGSATWTNVVTLNSNLFGKYYPVGTISGHAAYSIYSLNWGSVLKTFGVGTYRIKVATSMRTLSGCLLSDNFFLRQFTCQLADKTVKFEISNTGKIGAHYGRGKIFDMCGINYFDSFRFGGAFGKEKISEYLQVVNEFNNGTQNMIKNEAIQKYEFESKLLPKEYHDRLKTYMMMADVRLVSDYNISSPDYNTKQFSVFPDGTYEPEYYQGNRWQTVKVSFKAGVQNIIKSLCCTVDKGGHG